MRDIGSAILQVGKNIFRFRGASTYLWGFCFLRKTWEAAWQKVLDKPTKRGADKKGGRRRARRRHKATCRDYFQKPFKKRYPHPTSEHDIRANQSHSMVTIPYKRAKQKHEKKTAKELASATSDHQRNSNQDSARPKKWENSSHK